MAITLNPPDVCVSSEIFCNIITKKGMITSNKPTIEGKFYLYNETRADLEKNYAFLKSLYSGTLPMYQMNYARSPNIYEVEYPGHIEFLYSTLELKSFCEGQQKYIDTKQGSLDPGFYPAAWRIQYIFKCLIPWTFNQYIIYKKQGKDKDAQVGNNITVGGQALRIANAHKEAVKGAFIR
jgi:hypothetical protein